jgi:hypothetical protein
MIRATGTAQTILIAFTTIVLAQGNNTRAISQGGQPPQALSQTGTMYDGNNVNLQLPAEPNGYWANLWAAPISATNTGPASNVGAPAAAASVSGPPAGGEH